MIVYTTCNSQADLSGILKLQKANLANALTAEEIQSQGFVTVSHQLKDLENLNSIEKHVIAKDDDEVIAYLLAMTPASKFDLPILIPMFEVFGKIRWMTELVSDFNYLVVGQVCVSKNYRGQSILDQCYAKYKECYRDKYEFAITEIDAKNLRSLKAHERIGFKDIHRYKAENGTEWIIVLWDWK